MVGRYGHLVISFQTFWSDSLNVSMKACSLAQNDGMDFPTNRPIASRAKKNYLISINKHFWFVVFWKKTEQWKVMIKSGGIFWFGWFGAFHVKIKFGNSRGPTLGGSLVQGGGTVSWPWKISREMHAQMVHRTGIFTYISNKYRPNEGTYSILGASGMWFSKGDCPQMAWSWVSEWL